jgi:hypothetical protein
MTYTILDVAVDAQPMVALERSALAAQALAIDPFSQPPLTVTLDLTHFIELPYLAVTSNNSAVAVANITATDLAHGVVAIYLKPGSAVGAGTFSGSIDVTACLDTTCVNPVPGSPFHIALTYSVGSSVTVAGTNGYTVRVMPISSQRIIWDSLHRLLYAVLPFDTTGKSHIVAIDPVTQTSGTPVLLGASANDALAISDDNEYIYVGLSNGEIQRLALPALTTDAHIAMGLDAHNNPRYAADIQVAPAASHTIAVALSDYPFGNFGGLEVGVAIFDDTVMRPNMALAAFEPPSGTIVDYLHWGTSGTSLFGTNYNFGNPQSNFYAMNVNANGISTVTKTTGVSGGRLHTAQGLIYMDGGTIVDPGTNQQVANLANYPNLHGLLPDAANGRLFVSNSQTVSGSVQLQSLDLHQLTPIAQAELPPIAVEQQEWLLWGNDGIVIRTNNNLVFVTGNFVGP